MRLQQQPINRGCCVDIRKSRSSESTCVDSPVTDAEVVSVNSDERVLYCRNEALKWSTDETVLLSQCVDGQWTESDAMCNTDRDTMTCTSNYPKPNNTETPIEVKHATNQAVIAVYYRCESPGAWLSGAHGRVSQCENGQWTPVHDICDNACLIPRDCYEVADLGFNNTDFYMIVPFGGNFEDAIEVLCELETTADNANGRWTTALWLAKADLTHTLAEFEEGFGNPAFNSTLSFGIAYMPNTSLLDSQTQVVTSSQ
ncbi:uncharacterized protein LOC125039272 [Penaeus chinensis]|uniref:uncharacterized protein LOC125039272 n=1 Tax=Penaeus chinensis TaxID=139456 RepID=UPI001FB7A823|nr:uncharacterized protein LOC125039272 [Penaeus chinensis]